jgi:hypothetical protein
VCFNDSASELLITESFFFIYLVSECTFRDLDFPYWIGISTPSKIEKYVLVFGLYRVQNVFSNLQKSIGN